MNNIKNIHREDSDFSNREDNGGDNSNIEMNVCNPSPDLYSSMTKLILESHVPALIFLFMIRISNRQITA